MICPPALSDLFQTFAFAVLEMNGGLSKNGHSHQSDRARHLGMRAMCSILAVRWEAREGQVLAHKRSSDAAGYMMRRDVFRLYTFSLLTLPAKPAQDSHTLA
jgi:hypothetical protein